MESMLRFHCGCLVRPTLRHGHQRERRKKIHLYDISILYRDHYDWRKRVCNSYFLVRILTIHPTFHKVPKYVYNFRFHWMLECYCTFHGGWLVSKSHSYIRVIVVLFYGIIQVWLVRNKSSSYFPSCCRWSYVTSCRKRFLRLGRVWFGHPCQRHVSLCVIQYFIHYPSIPQRRQHTRIAPLFLKKTHNQSVRRIFILVFLTSACVFETLRT